MCGAVAGTLLRQGKFVRRRRRGVGPISLNSRCSLHLPRRLAYCSLPAYFNIGLQRPFGFKVNDPLALPFLAHASTRSCIATNRQTLENFAVSGELRVPEGGMQKAQR